MKKQFFSLILAASALMFFGCDNNILQPPGVLEFPDYTDQGKLMGDNAGLMDFKTRVVKLYERDILPLSIKNSGKGPLVINDIQLLQLKVPDANPVDAFDAFKFVEESFPTLPLEIPAGATVNDIFLEFDPETAGDFSGKVFIDSENGSYYIDMIGTGLWELTVNGNDDGKLYILDDDGSVIEEIDGAAATPVKATAADGVFNILCEEGFLKKFEKWQAVLPYTLADLEFANEKSTKTVVTLNRHATIDTSILDPYVRVPDDFVSLQDAINECYAHRYDALEATRKIAVIVSAGAHAVSNVTLARDVPVLGGYKTDWSPERLYKSRAERSNGTYKTQLNVSGTITVSGSDKKSNVVLEGFTIVKSGGGDAPLVRFDNGAEAVLAYNDITSSGSGDSTAVEVTNSAVPIIRYNYINGGNTSDNYSESHGLKVIEGGRPVVYMNSITGGTANGEDSISFGVYCDFEAEPYLRNNTPSGGEAWGIAGGSAPGSGGQSYGVYIINNGNVKARYNSINGGTGKTAVGMYAAYGGYIKADHNNIFTTGGGTRIALWIAHMGRLYQLEDCGVYDCSILYKNPYTVDITNIGMLQDEFGDSNAGAAVDLSGAPKVVEYE